MTDLPAYGTLTPSAEMRLYDHDRETWAHYVAQEMAPRMAKYGIEAFRTMWAEISDEYRNAMVLAIWPLVSREFQRGVWELLDSRQRAMVRAARVQEKAA